MIPPELEHEMRLSWAATIPEQYAYRANAKWGGYNPEAAIVLPRPPDPVLVGWFASFVPHLTERQRQAKLLRAAMGKAARDRSGAAQREPPIACAIQFFRLPLNSRRAADLFVAIKQHRGWAKYAGPA